LTGSSTIHRSTPALGGDLLAAMAQLIKRATACGGLRSKMVSPAQEFD
jgi:hypothetical protein